MKNKKTNNSIKKIGETLKLKRQEMQMSLKNVESATSIRTNHLQAIEEGTIEEQISPTYAQGFIRQYANFLEVDIEELIKDNTSLFKSFEKQDLIFTGDPFEIRSSPEKKIKWMPNLLKAVVFVIVILFAWFFAKHLGVF